MNVRNGEFEKGREGHKGEKDNGRKRGRENCSKEERVKVIGGRRQEGVAP